MGCLVKQLEKAEAFQITRDGDDWPEWVIEAFTSIRGLNGPLQIKTTRGLESIQWGDWIVRDIDGGISVVRNEVVKKEIERQSAVRTELMKRWVTLQPNPKVCADDLPQPEHADGFHHREMVKAMASLCSGIFPEPKPKRASLTNAP
jgi:hypothetical protein